MKGQDLRGSFTEWSSYPENQRSLENPFAELKGVILLCSGKNSIHWPRSLLLPGRRQEPGLVIDPRRDVDVF